MRDTPSINIKEEEKLVGLKSESSEHFSDQVPEEPQKPTISALSFPTDIVSDRKQQREEDVTEADIDEIEKLQKQFSETYMSKCKIKLKKIADKESQMRSTHKVHRLKLAQLPLQISRNRHHQPPLTERTLQHFRKHHHKLLEDTFEEEQKLASARVRASSQKDQRYNNQLEAITSRLDNIVTNLEKFNEKIQHMGRVSGPSQIMTPSSVHNIHPNVIGEIPFSDQSSKLSETRMMFTSASIGHKPSTQRNSSREPPHRRSVKLSLGQKLRAARTMSKKEEEYDDFEEIKFDELSSFASGPSTPHLSQIDSAYGTVPARKLSPTGEKRGAKIIINLDVARARNETRTEISENNHQQPQGGQMADNRKF